MGKRRKLWEMESLIGMSDASKSSLSVSSSQTHQNMKSKGRDSSPGGTEPLNPHKLAAFRNEKLCLKMKSRTFFTSNASTLFLIFTIVIATFFTLPVQSLRPLPPPPRHPPGPGGPRRGPPRDAPFLLSPHKMRVRERPFPGPMKHDLDHAAQTLYDLRGFNIPLAGQAETQRLIRQNDPFSFTRFQPQPPRGQGQTPQDSRTSPLVFPSFYEEKETSSRRPNVLNIFGHTQHLSQTKYEPAGSQKGSSSLSNSNLQGQPQTFRPSQIDVGFSNQNHQNQIQSQIQNFQKTFDPEPNQLQGRQVGGTGTRGSKSQPILNFNNFHNQQNLNQKTQDSKAESKDNSDDPFIYVYDDEDYEEGDDDFEEENKDQVNSNLITTPQPQTRVIPQTQTPQRQILNIHNNNAFPTAKPINQPTATPTPLTFFHQQQQQQQTFNNFPNFPSNHRLSAITPTPNVEINPSSERKPPPDQSNAVSPIYKQQGQQGQGHSQTPSRVITDDRFVRPSGFFPQSLEEDVDISQPDPDLIQKLNGPSHSLPPFSPIYSEVGGGRERGSDTAKLRPVNTLVPKNRVPQEDIVLPPNFPFHEDIPQRRPEGTRGDVLRQSFRPQQPFTEAPVLATPTPSPTPSYRIHTSPQPQTTPSPTPTRINRINQTRRPVTPASNSISQDEKEEAEQQPKRVRGGPSRIRTHSGNKLQTFPPYSPSTARTTTTTTTTTTRRPTPAPKPATSTESQSYEYYDEDEYEDEEDEEKPQVVKTLKAVTVSSIKSPIRPDFNNGKGQQNQDEFSVSDVPQRRVRPQSTTAQYVPFPTPTPFPSRNHQNQLGSSVPPRKVSTGKPLYYAGKMLAREGGLYAGRKVPAYHVYGQPVPNIPINSVFDRIPSVLAGNVVQQGEPVKSTRGRGRVKEKEHQNQRVRGSGRESSTPPSSSNNVRANPHSRLIHPSRIRQHQAIFTTSTERTSTSTTPKSEPERKELPRPVRPRVRPSRPTVSTSTERERESSSVAEEDDANENFSSSPLPIPRKKKVRLGSPPGKRQRQRQQLLKQEQSVTVSHSVREEEAPLPPPELESEDDQDRPEPPRRNLRPRPNKRPKLQIQEVVSKAPVVQVLQSQSTTESSSTEIPLERKVPSPALRPRKVRPRPKPTQKPVEEEQEEEDFKQRNNNDQEDDQEDQDQEPAPIPPPRPKRIRPKQEFSVSEIPPRQSSAKVNRKPTEAPNRFSSKFTQPPEERERVITSTFSSISEGDNEEERPSSPRRFSPSPTPKPRPSFKPKPPPKPVKPVAPKPPQKRVNNNVIKPKPTPASPPESETDDLPSSIRLSAKDVLLNRKPARRIPPGSASDKLKALQERRNSKKVAIASTPSPQTYRERESLRGDEEERDDTGHRTLRRRKLLPVKEAEEENLEQRNNEEENAHDNNSNEEEEAPLPPRRRRPGQGQRNLKQARQKPLEQPPEEEQEQRPQVRRVVKHRIVAKPGQGQGQVRRVRIQRPAEPQPEEQEFQEEEKNVYDDSEDLRELQQNKREIKVKPAGSLSKRPLNHVENLKNDKEDEHNYDQEIPANEEKGNLRHHLTEVSSDEARAVLGLPNAKENANTNAKVDQADQEQTDQYYEEEDYEGHSSQKMEHRVTTPKSIPVLLSSPKISGNDPVTGFDKMLERTTQNSVKTFRKPIIPLTDRTTSTSTERDAPALSSSSTEGSLEPTTSSHLKARLRPNKKFISSLQPRLSPDKQREKNEASRNSNLNKLLKFRTSSTNSPISSGKIVTMSTEDPSLPLEEMFSNVRKF